MGLLSAENNKVSSHPEAPAVFTWARDFARIECALAPRKIPRSAEQRWIFGMTWKVECPQYPTGSDIQSPHGRTDRTFATVRKAGLESRLSRGGARRDSDGHCCFFSAPTANVKLSDIKMSVAENFVGASFTYIDGTVTNTGTQTVTRATVHIVFRDSIGQVAQAEDDPLKILQTSGPYPDTVDLSMSPLAPGQSKQFRLTFEHISAEWNHAYPEVQITDVSVK
jgi:Protein of unknown function (DUF2393)